MNNRIRHLLHLLGEDKRAFGEKLGLKTKHVKQILKGKRTLDAELCRQIVILYPVQAHWLLTGEGAALREESLAVSPAVIQSGIHQHNRGMCCTNTMQVFQEDYRMQVEMLKERLKDKERMIEVLMRFLDRGS